MKKSIKILVVLTLSSLVVLSGCGKGETKEQLKEKVSNLSSNLASAQSQNATLKRILSQYDPNLAEVQGLTDFTTLATGEQAYISLRDRVNLQNKLTLDPSISSQNETKVNLTNDISYIPSKNWSMEVGSGSLKMNSNTGIYCEVETYNYVGKYTAGTFYQYIIQPHFSSIHAEQVGGERKVFLADGSSAGSMATARIKVAHMKNGDNNIYVEDKPTEATTEAVTAESLAEESTAEETVEETESVDENSNDNVALDIPAQAKGESEAEESAAEESAVETGAETAAAAVTVAETQPAIIEQNQADIYSVENYLYKVVIATYAIGVQDQKSIIFRFFYKESSSDDTALKDEYIDNLIKSFSISGNHLALQ